MKRLILALTLLTFGLSSAQQLTKGNHTAKKLGDTVKTNKLRHVVESYDQAALSAIYQDFNTRYTKAKQEADAYARANNIPIKKYNADMLKAGRPYRYG